MSEYFKAMVLNIQNMEVDTKWFDNVHFGM